MSVKRQLSRDFRGSQKELSDRVTRFLRLHSNHYDIIANERGDQISTKVQSYGSSTPMRIVLKQDESLCTNVTISTASPWYVIGDIFGLYEKMIEQVFDGIRIY